MKELDASCAHAAGQVISVCIDFTSTSFARAFEGCDGEAKSSVVGASEVGVVESECVFGRNCCKPF